MSLFGRKERQQIARLTARMEHLEEQLADKEREYGGARRALQIERADSDRLRARNSELARRLREAEAETSTTVEEEAVGVFSRRLDRALHAAARYLAEGWSLRADRTRLALALSETQLELEAARLETAELRDELKDTAIPRPEAPSALALRETARANQLARQVEDLTAANQNLEKELLTERRAARPGVTW